jgi:hypothetical protein
MTIDFGLLARLLAGLALFQGLCWLLARGLGVRLERHAWHVMLLGVLLPLLFLSPWLDRSRLFGPSDVLAVAVPGAPVLPRSARHDLLNDPVFQFLPWELEVRHAFHERRLPLWSDALDGGSSPWSNPTAAVLSPFAMAARAFPIQHHLLAVLAFALLVGFEGTWVLGRAVGLSRPARLLAAAGFCLGGGMMSWALFPQTATAAWVPWLAAVAVRLFRRGADRRTIATAALLTAALILSGHPEVAAIGGLFAALCGLALRSRRSRRRGAFARAFGAAALAGCLGLGLTAPLVLPFLALLPQSARAEETLLRPAVQSTWFGTGLAGFLLAPTNPRAFGRPFEDPFGGPVNWVDADAGYAGLVAFAGAWIALFASRRRRVAAPFLAFAAVSLLLTAHFLPLSRVLDAVPPLRTVAYARFLIVGSLALAVAGGMGIDALLRAGRSRRGTVASGVALALSAGLSLWVHADPWVAGLWLLLGAAGLAALRRPRPAAALLALVLLLDQVPWARSLLPTGRPELFYPPSAPLLALRAEVSESAGGGAGGAGGPWRAVGAGYTALASILPVYGIDEVRPHNPLVPAAYLRVLGAAFGYRPTMVDYFGSFGNLDHPLLDFLNVRAVVEASAGGVRVYRNPGALPRWFIPSGADVIRLRDLEAWIAALRDPRRVAVYERETGFAGTVTAEAVCPGRIILRVDAPRPALVATSLGRPEGWRVTAAGAPLPALVVNGAFLGFRAPAGSSRVELRFVPPGLLPGAAVAAAALIACCALLARRVWRER